MSTFTNVRDKMHAAGPEGWCKGGAVVCDPGGQPIKFCLMQRVHNEYWRWDEPPKLAGGAFFRDLNRASVALGVVLKQRYGVSFLPTVGELPLVSVPSLNDWEFTTYGDVMTAVERLAAEDEELAYIAPEAPGSSQEPSDGVPPYQAMDPHEKTPPGARMEFLGDDPEAEPEPAAEPAPDAEPEPEPEPEPELVEAAGK